MMLQSLDSDIKQSQAILGYIASVIFLPEMIFNDYGQQAQGYFLVGLPVTLPLSLMTAPIFFLTRQVKIAGEKIMQKIVPDPEYTDDKKVLKYLQKGVKKQVQVSQQTWKQAMKHASQQLFLKQKKRIIVINQLQKNNPSQQQFKKEKQFIFIVDQDIKVCQISQMIKKKINSQSDSMYLTFNNSVLPGHIMAKDITFNQSGIVKLAYASIETFG